MLTTDTADSITARVIASIPRLNALDNLLRTIASEATAMITADHAPRVQENIWRLVTRRHLNERSDAELWELASLLPMHLRARALRGSIVEVFAERAEQSARVDAEMDEDDGFSDEIGGAA